MQHWSWSATLADSTLDSKKAAEAAFFVPGNFVPVISVPVIFVPVIFVPAKIRNNVDFSIGAQTKNAIQPAPKRQKKELPK
jgi:hypothetical protein